MLNDKRELVCIKDEIAGFVVAVFVLAPRILFFTYIPFGIQCVRVIDRKYLVEISAF